MHHISGCNMGKPNALSHHANHSTSSDDNQNLTLLGLKYFVIRALKALQLKGKDHDLLCSIWEVTHNGLLEDSVAQAARDLKKSTAKSVQLAEWHKDEGVIYHHGKI